MATGWRQQMIPNRKVRRIAYILILIIGTFITLSFSSAASYATEYSQNEFETLESEPPPGGIEENEISNGLQQAILLQVFDTSTWKPPSPDPVGIDYHPGLGKFIISDSEVDEIPGLFTGVNIFLASPRGHLQGTCSTIEFSSEPTGVAVNPANGHTFFSDDSYLDRIFELELDDSGRSCPLGPLIRSISTSDFGCFDAEGLTFGLGKLFIVDGREADVFILSPGINKIFDGVPPSGDDQVERFDVAHLGVRNPKGITFDAFRKSLFLVSEPDPYLVEISPEGRLISRYDISFAGIYGPSGIGSGPRSMNPSITSLYITDRRVDNDFDPDENDGKIFEFAIPVKYFIPMIHR
jgi:hypothetical protein